MKGSSFKKLLARSTLYSGLAMLAFIALYKIFHAELWQTIAISFGTCFYHLAMRHGVGYAVDTAFHNNMDYRHRWFRPLPFEAAFYKRIKIKSWKGKIPTYTPEAFSVEKLSLEQVAGAMCQAEVVHELNILLSFVPLLFSLKWGAFPVFLITSVLAAGADSIFVLLQRSNRPRIVRIIERNNKTA